MKEILTRMLSVDREAARWLGREPVDAGVEPPVLGAGAKLCLFSAHDTTLLPMLVAMGVFDNKWPPYAAAIAFELYEEENEGIGAKRGKGDMFVRVSYNNKPLSIPGCEGVYCPLATFKVGWVGRGREKLNVYGLPSPARSAS